MKVNCLKILPITEHQNFRKDLLEERVNIMDLLSTTVFKLPIIKIKTIKDLITARNINIENEVIESSYDMHCHPAIILQLQGLIPFLQTDDTYSTYRRCLNLFGITH